MRIKAVTIPKEPGWLGGCETIMQSALGIGLELGCRNNQSATHTTNRFLNGNGVDHLWIDTLCFFPGISMFHFGGLLYGSKGTLQLTRNNEGWWSGTVNNYSAERNIEMLEWLLLLHQLQQIILSNLFSIWCWWHVKSWLIMTNLLKVTKKDYNSSWCQKVLALCILLTSHKKGCMNVSGELWERIHLHGEMDSRWTLDEPFWVTWDLWNGETASFIASTATLGVQVDGACVEHCPRTKIPIAGQCLALSCESVGSMGISADFW